MFVCVCVCVCTIVLKPVTYNNRKINEQIIFLYFLLPIVEEGGQRIIYTVIIDIFEWKATE